MECNAAEGRRSLVEVRLRGGGTTLEESLAAARKSGSVPRADGFDVVHVESDASALAGWDYDVGRVTHARASVASLDEVERVVASWGFDAAALRPHHQTDVRSGYVPFFTVTRL